MVIRAFIRVVVALQIGCFMVRSLYAIALAPGERLAAAELQVVNMAVHSSIESLEPDQSDRISSGMILEMVLEGLVRFESGGRFAPAAAAHWTHNAEQTVWRFYLRKEAKWSNGDPVKAEDFVRTYRNYCDPEIRTKINSVFIDTFPLKNAWTVFNDASKVDTLGVRAIDDHTLELEFERPVQKKRLLTTLTHPMFAPLHLHFLAAVRERQNKQVTYKCRHYYPQARRDGQYLKDEPTHEAQAAFEGNPFISNGPFVITDFGPLTKVKAVKNLHYWDANNVILEKINWQFGDFTDRAFWQSALRSDTWHMTYTRGAPPCPRDLREKVFRWGLEYTAASTQTTDLLILNTREARLQDLSIRQALDLLLNREAIVKALLQHTAAGFALCDDAKAEVSHTLVPPRSDYHPEYRSHFDHLSTQDRQQLGERLLRAAGYDEAKPLTLKLSMVSKGDARDAFFDLLSQQQFFQSALICLELESLSFEERDRRLGAGQFELVFASYGFYDEVPESIFQTCKSSERLGVYAGLDHPEYDELVHTVIDPGEDSSKLDKTERYDLLRQAEQLLMNEYALLPISHTKPKFIIKRNLRGFSKVDHPKGYIDLRHVYFVDEPAPRSWWQFWK